jgi:hypothetical protein
LYRLRTDFEDYARFESTFGRGMGEEQEEGFGEMIDLEQPR